jgi:hypothetical protein
VNDHTLRKRPEPGIPGAESTYWLLNFFDELRRRVPTKK